MGIDTFSIDNYKSIFMNIESKRKIIFFYGANPLGTLYSIHKFVIFDKIGCVFFNVI